MAETDPGERRAAGAGPGTERDTEPGTERGTERDTEPGTEPITERGTERDTEPITEPGTGPGTERDTEPITERDTEPGTAGWLQRPPYSFVALITMAIRASPGQRLSLSGIYAYIAERFPFYRGPGRQWQNSVRHNLSLNPCFRRLPCRHGRAGEWVLDPAFQDMFPGGNYLRRRRRLCRRPSASPPSPAGVPAGPAAPRAPPPSGKASLPAAPRAPPPPEMPPDPAAPWLPPPSGVPRGPAEPPQLPEIRPGPAALWPPPPCPVPPGWPQGPWAALVLPRRCPELPARSPAVPPGLPLPLPAWALRPAELDTAVTCDLGARLSPAFR
ncbi:forkhead box protein E3-like [Haemorhous mexicanus]|uniref:forkhead box protein E3-like n=1 Tax=Haemorhous mexicanus TaxID=30427 RepID=UPI0028BE0555|nr:forkhead box protein E3-like [Haemorhous mexicanus]